MAWTLLSCFFCVVGLLSSALHRSFFLFRHSGSKLPKHCFPCEKERGGSPAVLRARPVSAGRERARPPHSSGGVQSLANLWTPADLAAARPSYACAFAERHAPGLWPDAPARRPCRVIAKDVRQVSAAPSSKE